MIGDSIIIVGKGKNKKHLKQIKKFETVKEAEDIYLGGQLIEAFRICEAFNVDNVYLCNIYSLADYEELSIELREYDFTYIIFLDLLLTDYYTDFINQVNIFYYKKIVENLQYYNNSIILATTKHASLYKDIDEFLIENKNGLVRFKQSLDLKTDCRNMQLIANNLENYDFANVIAACMYCNTDISKYPSIKGLGKAIFDIDSFDVAFDMAYFKTINDERTIIDNLLNLYKYSSPKKIFTIDRILRYVKKGLDFSEFYGQTYTEYKKVLIKEKAIRYLNSLINYILDEYSIDAIKEKYDEEHPGTIIIYLYITIKPKNCLESISLRINI